MTTTEERFPDNSLIAAVKLLDALGIPADAGEEAVRIAARALDNYGREVLADADEDVPLGLAEVGDLFGIAEGTASKWHWRAKRGDFYFPSPDGHTSRSTPYWWESTMLAWAREVGRKTAAEQAAEQAVRAEAQAEAKAQMHDGYLAADTAAAAAPASVEPEFRTAAEPVTV